VRNMDHVAFVCLKSLKDAGLLGDSGHASYANTLPQGEHPVWSYRRGLAVTPLDELPPDILHLHVRATRGTYHRTAFEDMIHGRR